MVIRQTVLLPYSQKSEGAILLSKKMGIEMITTDDATKQHNIIGWGSSKYLPTAILANTLNMPANVLRAVDKKLTYEHLHRWGVRVPDFTETLSTALQWLSKGHTVVCRLVTDGKAGEGVQVIGPDDIKNKGLDFPHAPLYTKYVNKTYEYRVHVAFGEVIHVRKKVKPAGGVKGDPRVASHLSGWLFIKDGFTPPPDALRQAIKAVAALGLDFGAVDILYSQPEDKAFVCEVNTAPGLEVSEVQAYADVFNKHFST